MFDDLIHQALFVSGIHNLFDLTLDILDLVLWHVIQRRDLVIIKRQLRTNLVEQIQQLFNFFLMFKPQDELEQSNTLLYGLVELEAQMEIFLGCLSRLAGQNAQPVDYIVMVLFEQPAHKMGQRPIDGFVEQMCTVFIVYKSE